VTIQQPVSPVPFVDTHHHLWDLGRFRYDWLAPDGDPEVTAWLGDYSAIRVDYLIDALVADYASCGVVKSVHVQADMSEGDPALETSWLQGLADRHGFPHAIVGYADLQDPDIDSQLDRHCGFANFRGIRMPENEVRFADPALGRGMRALVDRGLSLELDTPPERMAGLARLATDYPGTLFFLGHAGVPESRTSEYFDEWRRALHETARPDNVVVKISGLGMSDHRWTTDSIRPWVLEAIGAFGVDRTVFGTNWPVDRLYSDLTTLVAAYRDIVSGFDRQEQDRLLFQNAERFYRI
jgi:predicted TIM-barrel fold metal-dependent hydrolase